MGGSNLSVILYIGEMELPDKNAAAQRVLANSTIIKEATNHEVILIGLRKGLLTRNIRKTNRRVNGFRTFEYPYPASALQWIQYITGIRYVKQVIYHIGVHRVEAVIAYNYPAIALERLRVFCKRKNIRLISDTSEWYGKSRRAFPSNLIKDFDTFLRMKVVNKKCGNLICASKYLEDYYKTRKCQVVNIPSLVVNKSKEINYGSDSSSEYKIFSFVGSPGRSREKERLDWIINFFHSVKERDDFRLLLVGVTKESFLGVYPEFERRVEELHNKIIFKGVVSHEEALNIISQSHFTVFARTTNRVTNAGFPTKLAESYACAVPVIATPSSNISDFIVNGKTGFVSKTCRYQSFHKAMSHAFHCSFEKILDMKLYLAHNNPLNIACFYEEWKKFYYGENK